jgi:hypothetical protein
MTRLVEHIAPGRPLRVLSLGAGVQSTTMLLMGLRGEFGELPDVAIFADTGWEPASVYAHLDWLEAEVTPFPIQRVGKGNIREDALNPLKRFAPMPLYTIPTGDKREGQARRQCTREYKIEPVTRYVRRDILGTKPRARIAKGIEVEMWMGISLDEAQRMKPNREKWITNRWPLIELRMNRRDCLRWLEDNGYPEPPKSACIGCPYTDNGRWREMKESSPGEFADAVAFDADIRKGLRGFSQDAYLHRSLVPLSEVDLRTAEDMGQMDAFTDECEGMCGV